ncbi:MAG: carboxypeptidase-like regulatory domain-containing protein, partial [bacterium]
MSLKNFTKGSCIMLGILLFMCLAFSVPDAYSISTISGTVRDQSSNPIVGIQVGAFDAATCPANFVNGAVTGPGGVYTIPVPAGTYKVAAQGNQTYSPQFYNQAFDCNTATSVPLSDGQTNDTVNFFLLPAPPNQGTISGTVMDESLNPISGVTVVIFDYSTGNPVGLGVATPSYSIYVPAGTYRVGALGNAQYSAEFYSNAPDFGSAWQVGVTSGQPTTNIDFSLASVPQTGSISGYVYDESGTTPIEGINVSANNYDGAGGGGSA